MRLGRLGTAVPTCVRLLVFVGWIFLLLQQPWEVEAGHPVFVGKQIDHAFAGGAFAAGGHPCLVAGAGLDDALHCPQIVQDLLRLFFDSYLNKLA